MIAAWMVYIVAVSGALGLAALALEHGLNAVSRPTRWVWFAALCASLAVPAVTLLRPSPETAAPTEITPFVSPISSAAPPANVAALDLLAAIDWLSGPLALLWVCATAAVLIALGTSAWRTRRQASKWVASDVGGVPVRYSASSGPAVVGCFPGIIVLPRWSRGLQQDWQAMMVAHEEEHLRAQDTALIAGALLIVAVIPWNPVVWWIFKRLKHSIELDCDRRVLRRGFNRRAYGNLLIELTQRARRGPLPAAAFAAPKPLLTRRIRLMTNRTLPGYRWHAAAAAATAVILTVIGCELPTPPEAEEDSPQLIQEREARTVKMSVMQRREAERAVAELVAGGFPLHLDGVETLKGAIVETDRALEFAGTTDQTADGADHSVLHRTRELQRMEAVRAQRAVEEHQFGTFRSLEVPVDRERSGTDPSAGPLVYVDGVRIQGGKALFGSIEARSSGLDLNPDLIERIEVIKGPAASMMFGREAESGVVRITTKAAERNNN